MAYAASSLQNGDIQVPFSSWKTIILLSQSLRTTIQVEGQQFAGGPESSRRISIQVE